MATNSFNCVTTAMTTIPIETKTMMTTTTIITTTTSDPGILCFHHCCVKVFCFILPRICPHCKVELYDEQTNDNNSNSSTNNTISNHTNNNKITNGRETINNGHVIEKENERQQQQHKPDDINRATQQGQQQQRLLNSRLLPFRLPYPFIRASQYPCAIILRPTMGDFLNDYNNTTDLHIAVTTSTGCVVEFDRYGLRRRRTNHMPEWGQCLLVGDVPEPWYDYWDQVLLQVCQQPDKWTVSHYHEDKHNCYTFVLTFLQALAYDKLSEAATSRTVFCERYIVPRTTTAGKYISLYRKLRDAGIYVHQITNQNDNNNNNNNKNMNNCSNSSNKQQTKNNRCDSNRMNRSHQQYNNNNNNNNTSDIITMKYNFKTKSNITRTNNNNNKNNNNNNNDCIKNNHTNGISGNLTAPSHSSNGCPGIVTRPHTTLCTIEE